MNRTSPQLEIRIKGKSIHSVAEVEALSLSEKEKGIVMSELIKLMNHIDPPFADFKKHEAKDLIAANEFLKRKLQGLIFNSAINKISLDYYEQNYASAAADLLINPSPIEIHCTEAGKGLDYLVEVMNIIAIKGPTRIKEIYLKVGIRPKHGGKKRNMITTNDKALNLDNLIRQIQKRGNHLIRVSGSIAVNIYYYKLDEEGCLILNQEPPKGFNPDLLRVKTKKIFDVELYNKRMMEMDYINKRHQDVRISLEKIAEISRYKNSFGIT